MIDVNKILFRCHRLGDLMTEPRSKSETLSETTKSYLKLLYRELTWDRKKQIESKYLRKGIETEENCLTLLSLEKKLFLKKNEERLNNDFITGIPDTYVGKAITETEEGYDVKSAFDWTTLPYPTDNPDKKYVFQAHGYMQLTGAKKWNVVHCLVNTPADIIDDEKKRLSYKVKALDVESSPEYIEGCKIIERNSIFDLAAFKAQYPYYDLANSEDEWNWDIPRSQRIVVFPVMRDEEIIAQINARVLECRIWIAQNLMK